MKQLQSFFLGILAALGALILEIFFLNFSNPLSYSGNNYHNGFSSFGFIFFFAVFIEEFLKALVIFKVLAKWKNITINSFFLGLGFSLLEISLVFWKSQFEIEPNLVGIIGVGIVHVSTAVILGYCLEKNTKNRLEYFLGGFILAFAGHCLFNILNIFEFEHQEKFVQALLIFLFFITFFLLFKPKNTKNQENI